MRAAPIRPTWGAHRPPAVAGRPWERRRRRARPKPMGGDEISGEGGAEAGKMQAETSVPPQPCTRWGSSSVSPSDPTRFFLWVSRG
jgi:hypothetical protein